MAVRVTFTRTGERRYRVSVEGPGIEPSFMEPAPGYDDRLPHDMAHFVVENELGITGGVFGQLAAGGHAKTFRALNPKRAGRSERRGKRIARENRNDADLSELVVNLACRTWNAEKELPPSVKGVSDDDIARIRRVFDEVGAKWSALKVGGSVTLEWTVGKNRERPANRAKG